MAFENELAKLNERARTQYLEQTRAQDRPDNVNHPPHYTSGGIECIEAIKVQMPRDAYIGFLQGNVVKYLWRWRDKAGVESLKKGQWYLIRLIKELENDV